MDVSTQMPYGKQRVGYLSKEAQELRQQLNHNKSTLTHPNPTLVRNFSLVDHQLIPLTYQQKKLVYVNSLSKLDQCCMHLSQCTEFSFDLEGDHGYNFHQMTCLLQISTTKYNFVIDTVMLYEHIGAKLAQFFVDPSKVKTVFGTADLNELKRDFGIFCNSVVDLQNVCMLLLKESQVPSFQKVVQHYVDKKVVLAKGFQRYPWRLRPLPITAIQYAERDSSLLFDLFQTLKVKEHEFFLNLYDYATTAQFVIRSWVPPKISPIRCFNVCAKSKYCQSSKYLNYDLHFHQFTRLLEWSIRRAKSLDLPRKKILSNNDLAKLCLHRVYTSDEVTKLASNSRKWNESTRNELLGIVKMQSCGFHHSTTGQLGYTVKISTGTDTESSDSDL